MGPFSYQNGKLNCEGLALEELAKKYGTPLYVYSKKNIENNCNRFIRAFSSHPTKICYAVKANYNLSILKSIFECGMGADVVSMGELERVLEAGGIASNIVFSGVGKKQEEIERAIEVQVASINVESRSELELIKKIAEAKRRNVSISVRVNPNIDVKTNPYIATGLYDTKFGVADADLESVAELVKGHPRVSLEGLACHIGSQITELKSFEAAARRLVELANKMKGSGFPIRRIDLGGGLGIAYKPGEVVPSIEDYAETILRVVKGTPFEMVLEPGRSIIGDAGALLTTVLVTKEHQGRHFTVVDAAMNDLIRPCLYDAYHEIISLKEKSDSTRLTDVVGPVCETGDFLALSRKLSDPKEGDLLLVKNCGAYGTTMSSNYNSRPRSAEVLISGHDVKLIRRRETLTDLWQHEL